VDGTDNGRATALEIYFDGTLQKEIPLKPDMSPVQEILNVTNVGQIKFRVKPSGGDAPYYGIGDPVLK
jgi:hypothetical protein